MKEGNMQFENGNQNYYGNIKGKDYHFDITLIGLEIKKIDKSILNKMTPVPTNPRKGNKKTDCLIY